MPRRIICAAVSIGCDPDAVMRFVSNVQNRSRFLSSLLAATVIRGEPNELTECWSWKLDLVGYVFEETGTAVQFEPSRLLVFETAGGIESCFTYRAELRTGQCSDRVFV